MKKFLSIAPVVAIAAIIMGAGLCHSEEFWLAQKNLRKLVLTPAQSQEIASHATEFQRKWNHTHSTKGCRYHEAHADVFVAASSGVLTDDQFKKFRGRRRNVVEKVGYDIRLTGQHIGNLLKLAENI